MKQAAFAALLVIATIHSAVASPVSDAARTHFTAIGAGDTSIIMVKVLYVLTYREGKRVNETWQIDPRLAAAAC